MITRVTLTFDVNTRDQRQHYELTDQLRTAFRESPGDAAQNMASNSSFAGYRVIGYHDSNCSIGRCECGFYG